MFLWIAIGVGVVAVAAWWTGSKAFRKADLDRLKNRLLGPGKAGKQKNAGNAPALIQKEQQSGVLVGRVMQRFQLQTRLQELLERARSIF